MGVRKNHHSQKSQAGQGSVEFVLLIVLGVSIIMGAVKILQNMDFVGSVTSKPWAVISGMIECGVWQPCGISAPTQKYHPSNRVISYKPDGQ